MDEIATTETENAQPDSEQEAGSTDSRRSAHGKDQYKTFILYILMGVFAALCYWM